MAIGKYTDLLKMGGFHSFLWTQFLGALNDNIYKMVVSLAAVNVAVSAGGGSKYLSLAQAVFILPFFLFSGYAGHVADVFSKRRVLIATKSFEIVAMSLALVAFVSKRIEPMLAVLFLMALQSTFFSPSKYGILPEMLPDRDLSRGNGLVNMTTFIAIVLGTSLGGFLFAAWAEQLWAIGVMLMIVAASGLAVSFGISRVPASGAQKTFRLNPWAEIRQGLKRLYGDRPLWLTVVGISYFWFLGALLQIAILLFGKEVLGTDELRISILVTFLAVGIAGGSVVAGRLSGDKVELGLVPLGSIGMGMSSLLLASSAPSYQLAILAMCLLGFSGGLFIVPLEAFLQQRSGREERGRLLAANNFLNTGGMLLASVASWLIRDVWDVAADQMILGLGLFTLAGTAYVLKTLPDFLIRFTLWLLTHSVYRIRIVGQEHVPLRGPALLVCNHISLVDGFLVGACVQRFIRFMVYRPYYEMKAFHWLMRLMHVIPLTPDNRKEVTESIARAREELRQGHVVCIFAEGSVSRMGNLLPFKRGFEHIVQGLDVPVIPVHLDRLWGSIFSFKDGRFFWKWPRRIPYPVTVSFGAPLPSNAKAHRVRQAVMELGAAAAEYRRTRHDLLHLQFIRTAKRRWFSFCMADSTGKRLNYGQTLAGSLALGWWIRRRFRNQEMLGLLLPASVAGAITNIAALLAGKVPVNLNFTIGQHAMQSAIEQCGVRMIFTSRAFLEKAKLPANERMIFLEDVMPKISSIKKVLAGLAAFVLPWRLLGYLCVARSKTPLDLATVIFSSGTTGTPKGVMLSHHNVVSNIESLAQIFWVSKSDRVMGILPFFHSFGFAGTLWFPLLSGFGAVYHPNPLDAKTVGKMVSRYQATVLIATPTFCDAYVRKCSAEQFSSLRLAMVGAAKLQPSLAQAFEQKYGLPLLEGYGCTEMSPVVSVNTYGFTRGSHRQRGFKPGTVGHPIPGVAVKIVDLATGDSLPPNQPGMLLATGPNRMMGYLNQPQKTEDVLRDGWYVTGDVAVIDNDGFIRITDRTSRFSKIAGEMVPHVKVEEVISELLEGHPCVVTAVLDDQKGERLVAFYARKDISPEQLWKRLCSSELPKLWLPKREQIYTIETIPILGTGKVDLATVRALAHERVGTVVGEA